MNFTQSPAFARGAQASALDADRLPPGSLGRQILLIERDLAGHAGAIIDLANDDDGPPARGGRDPGVPRLLTPCRISGPVVTGHTASYADTDAPIVIDPRDTVTPGPRRTAYVEGRCDRCIAWPYLARDPELTLLILQHERGCPRLAALLREAGVPS